MAGIEPGQYRKGFMSVWCVMWPHPRRKGFWVCADDGSSVSPPRLESFGRKRLEEMPLVDWDEYAGAGREHPGKTRFEMIVEGRG